MIRINLNDITPAQLKKLESGKTVQLKFKDFEDQTINDRGHFYVHPEVSKKIAKAHMSKTGTRVTLTGPEIGVSGQGFADAWRWIKNKAVPAVVSAAKFVKTKVIDSPLYQQAIRPELHKLVTGLEGQLPQNVIGQLVTKGIDVVGEKTGAYGLTQTKQKKSKKTAPKAKKNPPTKGGSFLPVGGSFAEL